MADVVDNITRSRMMSGIRSKNTKPEILIRSLLHRGGYRFRIHAKDLPGKPDIVLPKYKAVVFVHGCFWHGHDCRYFKWPKTRQGFWRSKIQRNQENDSLHANRLLSSGWRVGVVWECAVRERGEEWLIARMSKWLDHKNQKMEIRQ